MAGIGNYEKGKKFTLKSGNTTPFKQMGSSSPVKQVGGDAGEAIDHWKKYKAAKARDAAVDKLTTDKNISRKAFDTKLAKITKTVDPHPKWKGLQSKPPKGWDVTKKSSTRYYKPTNVATKTLTKQVFKQGAKKTIGKVASRLAGPIGAGLLAYDVLKEGVKRVAKGIKTGVPQTKLKGKNIKSDWKLVPKKKYTSSPAKTAGHTAPAADGHQHLTNEQSLAAAKRRKKEGISKGMSKYNIDKKKATKIWTKQNPPLEQPK